MSGQLRDERAPFLGVGWSFPPAFGPAGCEVAMVAGEEDVNQSLGIIFATQAWRTRDARGFRLRLSAICF